MRRTWMAVVLATGLVTTSCGSDRDDDPAAAASTTSSSTTAVEGEGAPGIGDPYFPGLGNGGYDVASYDLAISVDPAAGSLAGVATIEATATEGLTAFNLDLVGLTASAVTVDGEPAATTHAGRELRIEPATPIETGEPFTIEVTYGGQPEPLDSGVSILPDVGWFTDTGFSYVLSEPSGAATWFPSNDHPADKATFTFRIDVPEGIEAAANGTLGSRYTGGGRTTWVWSSDDPMATYLATVVVGELAMDDPVAVGDVVLRNVYAASLADAARDSAFALQPEMLEFFGERLGPYPFDEYGVVVVDAQLGVALETQTLSLFGNDNIGQGDQNGIIVAHELAHQWFGNAVSLAGWQDIWLNEGLATYAEWLWIEHRGQATLDESAAQVYQTLERDGTGDLPPGDPGAEEIFSPSVYGRGALTVYALRAAVGDEALGTILRRWVAVHTGGTATTADFVALAEEVSGAQLDELFDRWLYAPELPPLP